MTNEEYDKMKALEARLDKAYNIIDLLSQTLTACSAAWKYADGWPYKAVVKAKSKAQSFLKEIYENRQTLAAQAILIRKLGEALRNNVKGETLHDKALAAYNEWLKENPE